MAQSQNCTKRPKMAPIGQKQSKKIWIVQCGLQIKQAQHYLQNSVTNLFWDTLYWSLNRSIWRHGANFSLSSEGHWKICFESDFDSYLVENNFDINTGDIVNIILDWILTGECQQEIVCGGYSAGPDRILPSKDLGLGPSPPHLHTCILSNLHTWTLAHLLESEEYTWTMNIFIFYLWAHLHNCMHTAKLANCLEVLFWKVAMQGVPIQNKHIDGNKWLAGEAMSFINVKSC